MKGKISKIKLNELDDGRSYATLSINGDKYSLWDDEFINKLNEGDIIEYEFKQSGNYKNISGISRVVQQGQLLDKSEEKNSIYNGNVIENDISPAMKKSREIVRMSCLKSAIHMMHDFIDMDLGDRTDRAIDVARKFEKYITEFDEFTNFNGKII